jgi:hypothetical protein
MLCCSPALPAQADRERFGEESLSETAAALPMLNRTDDLRASIHFTYVF